ncbi:MAG TPA: hypothetical protein VGI39_25370, partial [Polyangiaceae bacterium]
GGGGGGGGSSGGGSGSGGLGGGVLGGGGGSGGGVNLADAACASSTSRGQQAPLDMYIMLDQSGSMSEQVAGNTSKWAAVTGALNTFVSGTNTAGISVGLQYFGLPPGGGGGTTNPSCPTTCQQTSDCGATGGPCVVGFCVGCIAGGTGGGGADSCTAADYAKADVEIAALPGVGSAITASIAKHSPSTSTPTSAALQGAVNHAQDWAKSHTSDIVIAVLATDGDPTECDTNLTNINAIAAAGVSGTPKVLTFVIGVGPSSTALNGIAAAGGTTSAFLVDTTMNVNQQFLDALNKIRGTALGCNYTIPVPTTGTPNYSEINVQYVPSGGGAPVLIPNVANASACPATGDAWYYDNPSAPTQIVLCPGTCKTVEADQGGEVQILLGCATIVK